MSNVAAEFKYNSDLVGGSLMVRESRIIAGLLLDGASQTQWHQAIQIENQLQKRSPATAKRNAQAIKKRLERLNEDYWRMLRNGDDELATQVRFLSDEVSTLFWDLENSYKKWRDKSLASIVETKNLEQQNNQLFISVYGLQGEINTIVPMEQVTLTVNPSYRYGSGTADKALEQRFKSDTLAELISCSIGCMMGRYSLNREGLIYAHAASEGFAELAEEGAYKTFPADDDGIIPLTDQQWFDDDATNRFCDFVKTVWGEAYLQENLAFIAESLCLHAIKAKRGEDSLQTIRRYLATKFYKDHLKTYKNRPIYWLFSSGKQKAFECLVYLHRYNAGTLARMRTEYIIPLTSKLNSHVEKLEQDKENSESTAEVKKIEKELQALHKKQAELSSFDEKLRHCADQRIELDLDDGVKVNYDKFGDLLADVVKVTGKKA